MSTPLAATGTAAAVEVHRSHFVSPVPSSSSAGRERGGGRLGDGGGGSDSSGKAGGRPATCSPDALVALESRRRELREALVRLREAKEAREASWLGEEDNEEEEEEEPRPRTVAPPTPIRV